MLCPRCQTDLREEPFEGVQVDRCGTCWGVWLDKGEFSELMKPAHFTFSDEEVAAVMKGLDEAAARKPDPALACPKCGKPMQKVRHNAVRATLTVDRCRADGLWLDTKELKQAQAAAQALRMVLGQRG